MEEISTRACISAHVDWKRKPYKAFKATEEDSSLCVGLCCLSIHVFPHPVSSPYRSRYMFTDRVHNACTKHPFLKRLKEMKQMSRDPLAAAKARKAERRADEKSGGITIKPVSLPSAEATKPTGFKKGGFKNAFGNADDDEEPDERRQAKAEPAVEGWKVAEPVEVESDEEWGDYDPRRPTGCWEGCPSRR